MSFQHLADENGVDDSDTNGSHPYAEADGGSSTSSSSSSGGGFSVDPELIEWVRDRITLAGFRQDAWKEAHNAAVSDFLSSKNLTKLVLYIDTDIGLCVDTLTVPPLDRIVNAELQYFLKGVGDIIFTKDKIAERLQFGLVTFPALDSLLRVMNRVYLPTFLSNKTWPESVKKDFSGQLHKFMASLTETANQAKGHTVLYLPDEDLRDVDRAVKDKDLVQRLESTLIHWTRQIKEVVTNQETSHHVDNSGPLEEIKFWRSRTIDLQGINKQLDRPGVRDIVNVLQAANSSYLKPFETLRDKIQDGSIEADDNLKFLSTLQEPCEALSQADPKQIPPLLKEVLNRIRMIWSLSKFYNKSESVTGLLRKVSNQIIIQCSRKIDLKEIFDGDVEACMIHLRDAIECGVAWKQIYQKTAEAVAVHSKAKWDFEQSSIFAQIDAFVQRCRDLLVEVCEGQIQFARKSSRVSGASGGDGRPLARGEKAKLPPFGGCRGPEIEKSLYDIEEAFERHIDRLRNLEYDILDVKATKWHDDYNNFTNAVKDLEVMMTNVISSAFDSISTVSAGLELLDAFHHLSKRPSMKHIVERKTADVYNMFIQEINSVKRDFDRHRKNPPLPPNMPHRAGTAIWARGLWSRISKQMKLLDDATYLTHTREADEARQAYGSLVTTLEATIKQTHGEWDKEVKEMGVDNLASRLERSLMVRVFVEPKDGKDKEGAPAAAVAVAVPDKKGAAGGSLVVPPIGAVQQGVGYLESNFDKDLLRLFNEVRYWQIFQQSTGSALEIPYAAHDMAQSHEQLRVLRENVMLVVRDYNTIIDGLNTEERRLFSEHLRRVDKKVAPGISKLTWSSKHIKDFFVRQCREQCKEVYDIVVAYNHNNDKVLANCRKIASTLLIEIEKNNVYEDGVFEEKQELHQEKVKKELNLLHQEIIAHMNATYEFFKDHPNEVKREWLRYVMKIDQKIEDSLRQTVKRSLQELARAINDDAKSEPHALFKVNVVLDQKSHHDGQVQFKPTMAQLQSMVNEVSKQLITTIQVVPRLTEVLDIGFDERRSAEELAALAAASTESEREPASARQGPSTHRSQRDSQRAGADGASSGASADARGAGADPQQEEDEKDPSTVGPDGGDALSQQSGVGGSNTSGGRNADGTSQGGSLPPTARQLTSLQQPAKSFYEVISQDDNILTILAGIMQGMENIASDLSQAISYWDRFKHIWDMDKEAFIRRYALNHRPLTSFDIDIARYRSHQSDIQGEDTTTTAKFIRVDFSLLKQSLIKHCQQWQQKLTGLLHDNATAELNALHDMFTVNTAKLEKVPDNLDELGTSIHLLKQLQHDLSAIENRFEPLEDMYKTLEKFDVHVPDEEKDLLDNLRMEWTDFQDTLKQAELMLNNCKVSMKKDLEDALSAFNQNVLDTRNDFDSTAPKTAPGPNAGDPDCDAAFKFIAEFRKKVNDNRQRAANMKSGLDIFSIDQPSYKENEDTSRDLELLEQIWTLTKDWISSWQKWKIGKFADLDATDMDKRAQTFQKNIHRLQRLMKGWKVWQALKERVDQFRQMMPLILDLKNPAMRNRHWDQLKEEIQQYNFDPAADDFTLDKLFVLGIHMHAETISRLSAEATRQLSIEETLKEIAETWDKLELDLVPYKEHYHKLKSTDEVSQFLEEHIASLANMKNSPYYLTFAKDINKWVLLLNDVAETIDMMLQVQRQWIYLESIFMGSDDIRRQLPAESTQFEHVNGAWQSIASRMYNTKNALKATQERTVQDSLLSRLTKLNETLEKIQKSLDQYLEKKRQLFPRFYFLSNDDLLAILGQSKDPMQVQKHIKKCFAGIKTLDLIPPLRQGNKTWEAAGMKAADGEAVKFLHNVACEGAVELWLSRVEVTMQVTLQKLLSNAIAHVQKSGHKRENWIRGNIGQLLILSGQISWTSECIHALNELHKNKKALRQLRSKWASYLDKLAGYIRSNLSKVDRLKLVALITIEVHARDVIERMMRSNITGVNSFEWLSQLRFVWAKEEGDFGLCKVKQTNTQFDYGYEYQGNNGRLVVTPLTDRCYMTLTTALYFCRGGSPQGPAGTGKTETVKDLAKGLGYYCVVFNCSETMDYRSLGRSFSGLAQTGAWGCFDEFNRIQVEVLSVVGQQISTILSAIRERRQEFVFEGTPIRLNLSCGIFITMNPSGQGYTGRSELPDNLKSLFRPVAMMVPDLALIAEIMLQSEGFKDAKNLSRKIVTLYRLMEEQFSKQDHYDFGLRAIKSVLTRAGAIYRDAGDLNEEVVLMRALRDMNFAKFVAEDAKLFNALLQDLFPNLDVPEVEMGQFEKEIGIQLEQSGLQQHPAIVRKVVQLYQTKNTRHGNMLVGRTCSGKSTTWKILAKVLTSLAKQGVAGFSPVETYILNPKTLTVAELYGYEDPKTKEWNHGVLSVMMRKICQSESDAEKWMILDGPVDTLWIESMNSVLDDSKILTLHNGERIALSTKVSLLFEAENLAQASPATVSRAGMVYLNDSDLGWQPFVTSWLNSTKTNLDVRALLQRLFDRLVVSVLDFKRKECKEPIPIGDINAVISLCRLFDAVVAAENLNVDSQKAGADAGGGKQEEKKDEKDETSTVQMRLIEMYFLFALAWSIGAAVDAAGRAKIDHCLRECEAPLPPLYTIYDYYIDTNKKDWVLWEEKVPKGWRPTTNTPFYRILVPTVDTVRHGYVLTALIRNRQQPLVVGGTGTGKTSLIQAMLNGLNADEWVTLTINFSSATSSEGVQRIIESRLDKRQRTNFGPALGKRLVTFVDDLNMPRKDFYGSQPALELLRQWNDYGFWYDRQKQQLRNILDMQLCCSMGFPGGARSVISSRFQSRFNLVNFIFPADTELTRIFDTIINDKLHQFDEEIKPLGHLMSLATLDLYKQITEEFLPTPSKSHYLFNLRDISKVFQGLLQADKHTYDTKDAMIKLWVHECLRVFQDRLVEDDDCTRFKELINLKLKTTFQSNWDQLFDKDKVPMFANFNAGDAIDEKQEVPYQEMHNMEDVKRLMIEKLEGYNVGQSSGGIMDLVMFQDAVQHVSRIHRILKQPRGNALLVGVGGSGRQSLTKLAAFIADMSMKVYQIEVRRGYTKKDFYEDLKKVYTLTGVERVPTVFLFADTQLVEESFLEDINNILSSGEIPNLFPADELGPILDSLRVDAQKENRSETQDGLYAYFIERVRNNLHLVLCMSPIGDAFRDRCRMYPALVNCSTIDWFSEWPEQALKEVARQFLKNTESGDDKMIAAVGDVFGLAHIAVTTISRRMRLEIRRTNYVTPTNYLDLVKGYRSLLTEKRDQIGEAAGKLRNGLSKLDESRTQVAEMTVELEQKKKVVAQKKKDCEKLLVEIVQQQRQADEQKKTVEIDTLRTTQEEKECKSIADDAAKDLEKAMPALEQANEALKKLDKASVSELKAYNQPPAMVKTTLDAVMIIFEKEKGWASAKKELNNANFLSNLTQFDKEKISNAVLKQISKFTARKDFTPELVSQKSVAAGVMCAWVIAMEQYAHIYREVAPKRANLREAEKVLQTKRAQLAEAHEKLRVVTERVAALQSKFSDSDNEKNALRKDAQQLEVKLGRAGKLVDGLASERSRWEKSIGSYEEQLRHLIGDCAVAAAFRSYAGPFSSEYRSELVTKNWLAAVKQHNIPCSPDFSFTTFLANPTDVREWNIQGLPSDDFSTENGVLVTRGKRWALMVDPQGQANRWIKAKEGEKLHVLDTKMDSMLMLRTLEAAVQFGQPVLLQDVGQELETFLDAILVQGVVGKKERRTVKFGDKTLDISPDFRLFLTTKLANPHYTPEVSTKTMIVNFAVKAQGLEEQLLGIVVRKEEPQLEADKSKCVITVATGKKRLVELEDEILSLLKSTSGSLLDDEVLINTLSASKSTSEEVKEQLAVSEETEKKIDAAREGYRPCAIRASILFFVLNDLANVDPMYQYSLDAYIDLFQDSITNSADQKASGDINERTLVLNNYHTEAVYKYVCRGLFEKHKLLFSFQMCIKKLQSENHIPADEYNFFLRGGQVLDRHLRQPNPCSDWLDESAWDSITELDKLPAFKNLASSFEQNARDWRRWYRSNEPPPEKRESLPGDWGSKTDELQLMILLRCLRPDRVVFAARTFIERKLGPQFVEPPEFNLNQVLDDSSCFTPIIFVLSTGVDPWPMLRQLAKDNNKEIEQISLGQGQDPIATKMLERGVAQGKWIFFANCHLSISWMPELEKLIEKYCLGKPSKEFRLWLSSDPHPLFPISILQRGIKITTEPPKGLRANISRLYNNITEEQFGKCSKPERYKKLLFSLCWFHSVLLERRKFQSLGWNILYDFNDSDFLICENILTIYLDLYDDTPWDALKYLIAEANYGGRVTDERDRRLLRVYINQYFAEGVLVPNFPLSALDKYYIPDDGPLQSYRDFVKNLPPTGQDHPEAFGQHQNADIASQMGETNTLLNTILNLQPRIVPKGQRSREEVMDELTTQLEEQLPQPLDLAVIMKRHESDNSPLKIVLLQEIARYNALLTTVHKSLADLQKGIKGLVVISSELEAVFEALYVGQVPTLWLKAYPSLKNLQGWARDLIQRIDMFKQWAEVAVPKVFWLAAFTFPSGFLTALLQSSARRNNVAIDTLGWEFVIMGPDEAAISVYPKEGAYIKGLFLEGARWDFEYSCLTDANPMELFCTMPIIHFKPVDLKRRVPKGVFSCPLYMYPIRTGTRERPSYILSVDLKTVTKDSDHWVKRGTALLLSLATS